MVRLAHKGLLLVSVPLIFSLCFIMTLSDLISRAEKQAYIDDIQKTNLALTNELGRRLIDATMAGAFYRIGKNAIYQERYLEDLEQSRQVISTLHNNLSSDTEAIQYVSQFDAICNDFEKIVPRHANPQKLMSLMAVITDMRDFNDLHYVSLRIEMTMAALTQHLENRERSDKSDVAISSGKIELWLATGLGISLLLTLGLGRFFARNIIARLHNVQSNARKLLRREPLSPPEKGTDELAQLDKVFHDTATDLLNLEQFKQQLIAVVSHDLRTPLTSAQIVTELFKAEHFGPISSTQREIAAEANTEIETLIRLTTVLLDIEKARSRGVKLHLTRTDLQDVIDSAVVTARELAAQRSISLQNMPIDDVFLMADEGKLLDAFLHALSAVVSLSPPASTANISSESTNAEVTVTIRSGWPKSHRSIDPETDSSSVHKQDKLARVAKLELSAAEALLALHSGNLRIDERTDGLHLEIRLPMTAT